MKKYTNIQLMALGIICSLAFFTSCEIDEPYIEPNADFEIWGVNPVTTYYEKLEEPYELVLDQSYDYIIEGEGQQFVFWFGLPGDSTRKTPSGSDFDDRGLNHLSKGMAAVNGRARFAYRSAGEFIITFVASSYSYTDEEYKEKIVHKDVVVVAPE